jgi:hypothetical protein
MRYAMPNFPGEFEIPDDWLTEAATVGFVPSTRAYRSSSQSIVVPLTDIEPPYRVVRVAKDWRGFDRSRFISVLKGIITATEIEPVPLLELPVYGFAPNTYRYRSPQRLPPFLRLDRCRVRMPRGGHRLTRQ